MMSDIVSASISLLDIAMMPSGPQFHRQSQYNVAIQACTKMSATALHIYTICQSTGGSPSCCNKAFACEKCLQPKNPCRCTQLQMQMAA